MKAKAEAARPKSPARTGRAGRARSKIADLPGLIPHSLVADQLGIIPDVLRDWVAKGVFPEPHSVFERTWLYRVDHIRAFLDTGKWPEGARFKRPITRPEGGD